MKIVKSLCQAIGLTAGLAFTVNAAVITVTEDNLVGAMTGVIDADAPLGKGALQTNGGGFVEEYLYWNPLGPVDYLLGDLQSVSFSTKSDEINKFFFQIYTLQDGINDGSWYGQRITFDTANVFNKDEQLGAWNTWSTSASENQLMASDTVNNNFSPSNLTLTDFLNTTVEGGQTLYAEESIFAFKIGTSTSSPGFIGAIDNLILDFGNKGTLQYDFEPTSVPEPETIMMLTLGLLGIVTKRRKATQ